MINLPEGTNLLYKFVSFLRNMKKTFPLSRFIIAITLLPCFIISMGLPRIFSHEPQSSEREFDVFPIIGQDSVDTVPDALLGKLSLFILAGQSNMSGRGEMPVEPQRMNPRVFVFGNDYRWHYAKEPIDSPVNQVDLVSRDNNARYSLATSFANTLLEKDSTLIIGFIPCARGATSIEKWQRNLSENSLYGSCLKRARAASTMGKIVGLLFYQGEADALNPKVYPQRKPSPFAWTEKFSRFVHKVFHRSASC